MIAGRNNDGQGPAGRIVDVGGHAVHVLERGEGAPVVLLHGAGGNLLDWVVGPMAAIAARHHVIALDRPGLGYSLRPPGMEDPREQARHLDAALERLGIGRAVLAGHSYGGAVALAWALERPERVAGLVLLGAPSQVWEGSAGLHYDILNLPFAGGLVSRVAPVFVGPRQVARTVEGVFAPQRPPDDYAARIEAQLLLRPESLRANAADIGALKPALAQMVPRYPGLRVPLMQLHGTADTTVGLAIHAEKLAAQLPGSRLSRLEGVGHMPHHARPEAVVAAIDEVVAASGLRPA